MYTTNSVLRSWTKLFVGTPRLSVNLQRKTWSGGTKWPQPTGRNLFFIRLKSQVLLCAVEICSHENLPPGSLWQIFNDFFQATLNYSNDVGGGQTWQADIWPKKLRWCFYAVIRYATGKPFTCPPLEESDCARIFDRSESGLGKKFPLQRFFFIQLVLCVWFLEIEGARKYSEEPGLLVLRLEIQVFSVHKFSFWEMCPNCNFFRNDADVVAVRYNCSFTGWTSTR